MWLFSKLTPIEEWKLACYFNPSLRHEGNRKNMQPIGWRDITAAPSRLAPATEDMSFIGGGFANRIETPPNDSTTGEQLQ